MGWTSFAFFFGYVIDTILHRDFFAEVGFSEYAAGYVISTMTFLVILIGFKNALSAFFYAEFFTTIWAVLYFVAGSISRLMLRSQFVVTHLVRFFDVETKPLQSIGFVAGCLAAVSWWAVTFLPIEDTSFIMWPRDILWRVLDWMLHLAFQ